METLLSQSGALLTDKMTDDHAKAQGTVDHEGALDNKEARAPARLPKRQNLGQYTIEKQERKDPNTAESKRKGEGERD